MARLLIVVSLLMMSVGLVIAWPLVRAAVEFRPVRGQILDVIALPAAGDRVQLAFAYEYPLPTNGEHAIGYALTDERLQPVADPVTDAAQANAIMNYLRKRPGVRVYYDVNHPIGLRVYAHPSRHHRRLCAQNTVL